MSWPKTLTIFFFAPCFLTVAPLDTRVLVSERNRSPNHHLIDRFRPRVSKFFIVLAAFTIAVLTEWTWINFHFTLGKALTVKFQAFWLFAVAFGYHSLVGVFDTNRHFMGFLIPVIARRVHSLVDQIQNLRRRYKRGLSGLLEALE